MLDIYTDGACSGNPGAGGYALVVVDHESDSIIYSYYNGDRCTTNNRMELSAVLVALTKYYDEEITIYSDSSYIINAINNKWIDKWIKKNFIGIANSDLWNAIIDFLNNRIFPVKFIKVKGHSDNIYNNKADELACKARDIFKQ